MGRLQPYLLSVDWPGAWSRPRQLKDKNTSERNDLKKKLKDLEAQLKIERANMEMAGLHCEQAEIRIKIAEVEEWIARKQSEIARKVDVTAAIDVTNADLKKLKADLEKQVKDLEAKALKLARETAYRTLQQRRAELAAAEAEVAKAKHRVRAKIVEQAFADQIRERQSDFRPLPDDHVRVLLGAYDQKLEEACASARELLHLMRWIGSPVAMEFKLPRDRLQQRLMLEKVAAAISREWNNQQFQHRWIEIDLDRRTAAGDEHMRQLFSLGGLRVRLVPGLPVEGAVSLGPDGLLKRQGEYSSARIVTVVTMVGYRPENRVSLDFRVPNMEGEWTFDWSGVMFRKGQRGDVQSITPPNRASIRKIIPVHKAVRPYQPYNLPQRDPAWQFVGADTDEGMWLRRSGFWYPSSQPVAHIAGPNIKPEDYKNLEVRLGPFARVSDGPTQQPISNDGLEEFVKNQFQVQQIAGLRDSQAYRNWLGPPLYGEHRVKAPPLPKAFKDKPVDNIRMCILFVFN